MRAFLDNTSKDRMKSFLLKEDMADVHFLVGFDDVKEQLPAHKIILRIASEVFHRQLDGHFEVQKTIVVADATPDAFKLLLSYIYTDEIELTPDNAFPVLYLAQKYLLKDLAAQSSQYVATTYGGERVAEILPHLHLVEEELAQDVWQAIDLNADVILNSPEFLELDHNVLCRILRRDFDVDELTVYNKVVSWAEVECKRQLLSFPTDVREVLRNAVKLIRFPLMSIEEFAKGPADSNLLSAQEMQELCKWYGLRTADALATFSSAPRIRPVQSCIRFDLSSAMSRDWPNTEDYKQRFFNFSVNARVRFHGVGFLGRKNESVVYEITAGIQYKLSAVSFGPPSMCADNGRREVPCEDGGSSVTFSFTDTELRTKDQYDVSLKGHIPVIYFSFA